MEIGWSVQWYMNGKPESFETVSRREADIKAAEMRDKGARNVTIYQCFYAGGSENERV